MIELYTISITLDRTTRSNSTIQGASARLLRKILGASQTASNQITVVSFQPVQLAQASFLQKNRMSQNVFLIHVTLSWHRASVACKNQSF